MKHEPNEALRRTLVAMAIAAMGAAAGCKGEPAPAAESPVAQTSTGGEQTTAPASNDLPAGAPAASTEPAPHVADETACGHGACS